ncbi:hypothetical protein WMF04_25685 [Sorangium sp. So ce260]|uniref:hypothetical protein n=1 Tax=Sorangium sp. So ce260 TaxID=3133291 RepID=UPI003F6367F9
MRVRLILENGGHDLTKVVEMNEAPAVGAIVLADRERHVASVEHVAERDETNVYLREDAGDLSVQLDAAAHLTHIDMMKAEGWEIEGEQVLRAWLMHRIERQGTDGPVDPD